MRITTSSASAGPASPPNPAPHPTPGPATRAVPADGARRNNPVRGILFMIAAIGVLSVLDLMSKAISERSETVMALWARYAGQTAVVLLIIAPRLRQVVQTRYPRLQALRSLFLLAATSCFFFALAHMGLAEATAIMEVSPMFVTLGGALFLSERLGWRRMIGVTVALIGALIIIRPGTAVFSPAALLPLAAAFCFSAYALVTRFVGRDEDIWTSMLYTALLGTVVLSAIVPAFWVSPDGVTTALLLSIGVVGAAGQLLLIRAFTEAEAGTVAPFTYTGLLFATVHGIVFFDEWPDMATCLGALVIVAAGLYVWRREVRAARTAR